MPDISPALAQRIETRAQAVLDLGAITPAQFAALTDGNITKADHAIAGGAYGKAFSARQYSRDASPEQRAHLNAVSAATYDLWIETSRVDTRSGLEKVGEGIDAAVKRIGLELTLLRLKIFGR